MRVRACACRSACAALRWARRDSGATVNRDGETRRLAFPYSKTTKPSKTSDDSASSRVVAFASETEVARSTRWPSESTRAPCEGACMHARARTHPELRAHAETPAHQQTYTYACTRARLRIRSHAKTHARARTHTRTHSRARAHTHTRTHTHADTHRERERERDAHARTHTHRSYSLIA